MRTITKIFFFSLLLYTLHTLRTYDSYAQLVSDFKVNDDMTNTEQFSAKLGIDSSGNFTAVWRDQRNNRPNIYGQRFNSNGMFLRENFRININPDSSGSPAIAVAKNGIFGVCWVEINGIINNSSKVKFRLYNSEAQPHSGEIVVNDTNGNFSGPLSVGVNQFNEYTITWEQKNILFQRLDSSGNKIENNKKVNDDTGNNSHKNPAITVRQDGSFIITWNDTRPPSMDNADDIYMQMFDEFGNRIGNNIRVNDDTASINLQFVPKISSDSSGNFVIAWNDGRLDIIHGEIYAQRYDNKGNKIGQNFRATQSALQFGKGIADVFMKPGGDFIIGWGEFRPNIPQCYFQRYDIIGNRIGNNYLVSNQSLSTGKYYSDLIIYNDKIISVWSDERNGPFDVYCNIRSFRNPDTLVNILQTSTLIPERFSLFQNYPNPFNSSTTINFDIKENNIYRLAIYNPLGKEITEIFNNNILPGSYKLNYSTENLPSGVYYYILSSPKERRVKSFVLLK